MYAARYGAGGETASIDSIMDHNVLPTIEWSADADEKSSISSTATSPSRSSSYRHDDLDLDSLFKRLDKYTAEMEEVEARLKRARSTSERSENFALERFSFEASHGSDAPRIAQVETTPPRFSISSSSSSARVKHCDSLAATSSDMYDANKGLDRVESNAQPSESLHASLQPDEIAIERRRGALVDWKQWAEQQFGAPEQAPGRSSSRYSHRVESFRESAQKKFVWNRQSPSPPLPLNHREAARKSLSQRDSVPLAKEDDDQYDEFAEDEEPALSAPISWSLPPRTSSRTFSSEGTEASREVGSPSSRPSPRRGTTRERRSSVRNAGFWSVQAAGLFIQENIPPVPALSPALSQSPSTVTPKSSPPPTPLTLSSPQEEEIPQDPGILALTDGRELGRHTMLDLLYSDAERGDWGSFALQQEHGLSGSKDASDDRVDRSTRSRMRRRKSIFSIFQRRSPIEKVIDLYFDQDQDEKAYSKRASIWSRKSSPTRATLPRSPPVPPLPPGL